jgi:PKHD-type hydroxylase
MLLKPLFEPLQTIDQTEYYWFNEAFSDDELEWINNLKELYPVENAETNGISGEKTHKSMIKWINYDNNSSWLYERLSNFTIEANNILWNFNLNGIIDLIQYTEYIENVGNYDWHVDIGPYPINHRKISIVTLLSDPNSYEGGDLEIWSGGKFKTVPRIKGCTVLFPSFLLHRITPITKGVRKSLVLWIGNNNYK